MHGLNESPLHKRKDIWNWHCGFRPLIEEEGATRRPETAPSRFFARLLAMDDLAGSPLQPESPSVGRPIDARILELRIPGQNKVVWVASDPCRRSWARVVVVP